LLRQACSQAFVCLHPEEEYGIVPETIEEEIQKMDDVM
jgi:hypothetical protein